MRHITRRSLSSRSWTVCPEDPTAAKSITINERRNRHRRIIKLVQIWDLELVFNGRRVAYGEKEVTAKLLKLCGLTPRQLRKAYERVHPYFDDPMGHPSMYE